MGFLSGLLDVVLPPTCAACDEVLPSAGLFCAECEALTSELPPTHCRQCSEPGRFARDECPRCQAAPPPFVRAWAPFEHEGSVARAIHRFKYGDRADLAGPLGSMLALRSRTLVEQAGDCVVAPIPLHDSRYRDRQYDQACLLADALARASRLPLDVRALTRARATERQVGLSDAAREQNIAGAFTAAPATGRTLVIVDDVYTTGATASEAAKTLLLAGARAVFVLTIARARRLSLGASTTALRV